MPAKLTTEQFITKARAVHGESRYDYSQAEYVHALEKVKIMCLQHGVFEQVPSKHWSGQGCPTCGNGKIGQKLRYSTEAFIEKAKAVHGATYNYCQANYQGNKKAVQIGCPVHGNFFKRPADHLKGQGCPLCGNEAAGKKLRKSTADFIKQARAIHGDAYNYELVCYKKAKDRVQIICKKHGEFSQEASTHSSGKGCKSCGLENSQKNGLNGWSRTNWIAAQKGRKCTLYVVCLRNDSELFYKVGITYTSIGKRFNKHAMPYHLRTVALYKSYDAGKIYDLEKEIHRALSHLRYSPCLEFGGHTECFSDRSAILALLPASTFILKHVTNGAADSD